MSHYSDFETLLERQSELEADRQYNQFGDMKNGVHDSKQLKSNKSATLFDFIKMLDRVITLTMKDLKVEFIPDEGKVVYLSNEQQLDHPIISYRVLSKKPMVELKPRHRETFNEKLTDNGRCGDVYGQRFKCHIQFDIHASEYKIAEEVLDRFETLIVTYTGYFKENGVGEILYSQQYTDENFKSMRQTLSIRNVCYYVEIEKLTVIMNESIKQIDIY